MVYGPAADEYTRSHHALALVLGTDIFLQEWRLPARDGGGQENPCPRAAPCGTEQKAGGIQRSQQGGAGAGGRDSEDKPLFDRHYIE